jgi:UDP-glucuronate decarboxylase
LSNVMEQDIAEIIADRLIPWGEMRSATVLVTGATGMIGAAVVRALSAGSKAHGLGLRVLALGRNEERLARLARDNGAVALRHDIREPLIIDEPIHYIFHCAAVTQSKRMASDPVGVALTTALGTAHMLELAREKAVRAFIYLSSMEVYGHIDTAMNPVTEDYLGYLDLTNPRSCYPESKRMAECLCRAYLAQYGLPVRIARLAQTFGAGMPCDDPRVVAQFMRSALAGEAIVLHTEGRSVGNYCYLSDAVRALLLMALRGFDGEAYNVCNPEAAMTVREMAVLVADGVCGGSIAVKVHLPADIARLGYAPDATAVLSSAKLEALGWQAHYNLKDMFCRTMQDWRERGCAAPLGV